MARRQPSGASLLLLLLLGAAAFASGQPPEMSLFPATNVSLLAPPAGAATANTSAAAVLSAQAGVVPPPQGQAVNNASVVPDLLPRRLPAEAHAQWAQVGQFLWDILLGTDHDYFDAAGSVVPRTFPDIARAASGADVKCGRVSRQWLRLAFHDCGTYSKFLRAYGCNGSIRKELQSTDPWVDYTRVAADGKSFEVLSGDVFDQFRDENGELPASVDPAFNPGERFENGAGFATSLATFYAAQLFARSPEVGLRNASIADIIVYAAGLGLARCDGPHVVFIPGRRDTSVADPEDLLAEPTEDFHHILHYFLMNGLSELDGVVLLSSHTTACFAEGCLDSTPTKFDATWAREVLANDTSVPACQPLNVAPAVARCRAPMDVVWLEHPQTVAFLQLLLNPAQDIPALQAAVGEVIAETRLGNYAGLLPRVNLCTPATCPTYAANYALFNLFASSWFRVISQVPAAAVVQG